METSSEYDEEEEENEERPKKKRKTNRYNFIIDKAEIDDEVEHNEEWEEDAQEIGIAKDADELELTAYEIDRLVLMHAVH